MTPDPIADADLLRVDIKQLLTDFVETHDMCPTIDVKWVDKTGLHDTRKIMKPSVIVDVKFSVGSHLYDAP